nr:PREDICTED: phosphatidylinositol-binding clathrin assembly protein-like [Latimeria chalumnae]|eukprot:XP_014343271.1 PREDICTED: phosphatidylinositol-binding clathrin assembly protein-like [Latimeria chalumnae]
MSGQSITDRIAAAQHSVTGSSVSKAVCKATTHEVMGPKKKHLDYLIQCTNEMNVNIPQLADTLFERTANSSWVVVFKALITTHHLMMYGNERFTQYLASRNTLFNLNNFLDKGALQGDHRTDGVMRTMSTEKLLKTLPIIQNQLDALLDFDANPNELTNGVINAAFMLLFKDSIRLFAAYNEGIINLLEKYFDMKKNQCKEALDIYKKFLARMTKLSEFLKVAEQVGIDQGDIPDLTQAPSSLLEALEQHLASLEGKKTKELSAASRASTLSNAVSTLASTGLSFSKMDEKEKQQALEEEQARLQALKEQRLREINLHSNSASNSASPSSISGRSVNTTNTAVVDLFSAPAPAANSMPNLSSDLFDLQPAFVPTVQSTPAIATSAANAWGGFPSHSVSQSNTLTMNVDFDAVFGARSVAVDNKSATGDILKPIVPSLQPAPLAPTTQQIGKLVANDLDSSLANLVGNLSFGGTPTKKSDMQWNQPTEKKLTGGNNWQQKTATSTTWTTAPVPQMNGIPYAGYTLSLVCLKVPSQMTTAPPVMAPQPMTYPQPVMRPTNPFAPVSGAQIQFM